MENTPPIPVLRSKALLGHYLAFRTNPIKFLMTHSSSQKDVYKFRVGHRWINIINGPLAVREILMDKSESFVRGKGSPDALKKYIGSNILTESGELWDEYRGDLRPLFKMTSLSPMLPPMYEIAKESLEDWDDIADKEGKILISQEMMKVLYQMTTSTFFGYKANKKEATQFVNDFSIATNVIFNNFFSGIPGARLNPSPSNFKMRRALNRIKGLCQNFINQDNTPPNGDIFNYMDRLKDSSENYRRQLEKCPYHSMLKLSEGRSKDRILDQVLTLIISAPENPSNTLVWALYLLAQNQEVEERLRNELRSVLGERDPSAEDFKHLEYTKMVINETLRLYPGAWAFEREATKDQTLRGHKVKRGDLMVISPYLLHRNESLWPDAEKFNPDRFKGVNAKEIPTFSYMPFGHGPRLCVGIRYAHLEMRLILPMLLRRYKFSLEAGHEKVKPNPMFTLRPPDDFEMKIQKTQGF